MLSWIPLQLIAKHWRSLSMALVVALVLTLIGRYIYRAEAAKRELTATRIRAEVAEGLITGHQHRSDSLTRVITTLRGRVPTVDSAFTRSKRAVGKRRIIIVDSFPLPQDSTETVPAPGDTVRVADLPEVKQLIADCEARVAVRDTIIQLQDIRHVEDSLAIQRLNDFIKDQRPPKPSRWKTILKVATGVVLVGAVSGAFH